MTLDKVKALCTTNEKSSSYSSNMSCRIIAIGKVSIYQLHLYQDNKESYQIIQKFESQTDKTYIYKFEKHFFHAHTNDYK